MKSHDLLEIIGSGGSAMYIVASGKKGDVIV